MHAWLAIPGVGDQLLMVREEADVEYDGCAEELDPDLHGEPKLLQI